MKKAMGKKIISSISIVLALVLVALTFSGADSCDKTDYSTWMRETEFAALINKGGQTAANTNKVKLTNNVYLKEPVISKNFVNLDLNGYTIDSPNKSYIFCSHGSGSQGNVAGGSLKLQGKGKVKVEIRVDCSSGTDDLIIEGDTGLNIYNISHQQGAVSVKSGDVNVLKLNGNKNNNRCVATISGGNVTALETNKANVVVKVNGGSIGTAVISQGKFTMTQKLNSTAVPTIRALCVGKKANVILLSGKVTDTILAPDGMATLFLGNPKNAKFDGVKAFTAKFGDLLPYAGAGTGWLVGAAYEVYVTGAVYGDIANKGVEIGEKIGEIASLLLEVLDDKIANPVQFTMSKGVTIEGDIAFVFKK